MRRGQASVLILPSLLLLLSCGGGGGGGGNQDEGNGAGDPPIPPITQSVTVNIEGQSNLLGLVTTVVLPQGAPQSQEPPSCAVTGICRGIISATAVEDGTFAVNIASALDFAASPGPCFICSDLTVPQESLPSDYACDCQGAVNQQDLQLNTSACPFSCSITGTQ